MTDSSGMPKIWRRGEKTVSEPYIDETTLDLKDLLRILKKQRWLILCVLLIAVVCATVLSFMMPKIYQAETTIRIKQSQGLASSLLSNMTMTNPMMAQQQMSTYEEIMKSRTVIEQVIQRMYSDRTGEEKIPKYRAILERITTSPVKNTQILKIQVVGRDSEDTALLANTVVDTFMDRITYLVRSEQKLVREFIGERLKEAKLEMEKAESALELYKRDQKIITPESETQSLVQRLSGINQLQAENTVTLASVQARLDSVNRQLAKEKPGYIAENALIQQYKSKLSEQEIQLVGLLQKYTEKYPEVAALRAAIAETKAWLNAEIARVVNAEASSLNPVHQGLLQGKMQAEAEMASAAAQKDALEKIVSDAEAVIATLPAKEQGFVRVTRDAAVAQSIYTMLANRYEEARISEVMQPTDVQVIDVAVAPDINRPIKPKKIMNVMIAAFLGLFAGVGLAFALEYINKTISNADDVKNYLDLPVLGNIPEFEGDDADHKKNLWDVIRRKAEGGRRK
jgi:succinoglycan biosynthesis transport protein ExoP